MSAAAMIRTFSDEALNGAIRQLSFNHEWPSRLRELLAEKSFRKASNLSVPFSLPDPGGGHIHASDASLQNAVREDLTPALS